ncbi:PREDICTED: coiled-coil domain-containing protein 117 [Nanorana parkeri]|uniref:coiled-coil domain-containing protein 117 n=1 Tax=Nanorana parkeri TaxID=125878 RepID=UPI000854862F|nr:PREDICTED: coiled-coil domain-containing protein 117 [Nanorana parkeri]
MAAIDRAFSAIPLCRMEYHQPDSFLQRTNTSGIVDSPFLDTSASPLNQINSIPMATGLNTNGSCFSMYSPFLPNPVPGGESMGMFLGNALPMPNPDGTHVLSQTCTWPSSRMRKKHRQDQDSFDCPSKRRKLCVSPVLEGCQARTTYTGDASQPRWSPSLSQVTRTAVAPSLCIPSPEMQAALAEGMDETTIESQSDAALRRIRDIESRLVLEEDDDEEEDNKNDRLPTLVMSDVLVESLKKGLDESLTKKIVDSMNRPSMELVLWKPQPEFLLDKLQSFTGRPKEETKASTQNTPRTPFLRQVDRLEADKPHILNVDCDVDPMWGREEEEMEL